MLATGDGSMFRVLAVGVLVLVVAVSGTLAPADAAPSPPGQVRSPEDAVFTVNSSVDETDATPGNRVCASSNGRCTLRAAIVEANAIGGAVIFLPASTYTITRVGQGEEFADVGDLDIRSDIRIIGEGVQNTVIDANGQDRIFDVFPSARLDAAGMTLKNGLLSVGDGSAGAGVQNRGTANLADVVITDGRTGWTGGGVTNHSVMSMQNVVIRNGRARSAAGVENLGSLAIEGAAILSNTADTSAGGISNSGNLTMSRATVAGNLAGLGRFTQGLGGGIVSSGSAALTNVTISGNTSGAGFSALGSNGGGYAVTGGLTDWINVTVSSNVGQNGLGTSLSHQVHVSGGATLRVGNSVVGPTSPDRSCQILGTVTSLGFNIDAGATCGFVDATDRMSTNPMLAGLADNGGTTLTHLPQSGSPAIDGGFNPNCAALDQRGFLRPVDGDSNASVVCDIGAVEVGANQAASPTLTATLPPTITPTPTVTPTPLPCSPRPAVKLTTQQTGTGTLTVTLASSTPGGQATNTISSVAFGAPSNATVQVPGQNPRADAFVWTPGTGAQATFIVRRVAPGPFTVHLVVKDACGDWPTFVGGGANVP